ncbi:hypothetical protein HPG69_005361 [Diceros bicornis minor]|uniref:Uncharacterized protein n=1 Tax=Diceros bicornis minor TaxID=77932 RepID=A0A7J7EMB1_DICBM|nr:hypothetical protein HPG69_005361 [Diceros bicornis minor]
MQDMKARCVSLWILGATLLQCSVHARGLRRCLISTDMHRVEESFREIRRAIVSTGLGRTRSTHCLWLSLCFPPQQAKDSFQNVTILSASETLHSIKALVCLLFPVLFYVSVAPRRVLRDQETPGILHGQGVQGPSGAEAPNLEKNQQHCQLFPLHAENSATMYFEHLFPVCPREGQDMLAPVSHLKWFLESKEIPCPAIHGENCQEPPPLSLLPQSFLFDTSSDPLSSSRGGVTAGRKPPTQPESSMTTMLEVRSAAIKSLGELDIFLA